MDHKKIHADHDLEHHDLLRKYSEHSYKINDDLYNAHVNGEPLEFEDHVLTLDSLIKNPAKYNFTVFTGLKWNPEDYWERLNVAIEQPIIVHLPAFTSTTTDFNTAVNFCRFLGPVDERRKINFKNRSIGRHYEKSKDDQFQHVIELRVPQSLQVGSLKSQSRHPIENEIIIKRGINTKIHPSVSLDYDENDNFVFTWVGEILK